MAGEGRVKDGKWGKAGWKGSSSARSLASHGMAGGKIKWPRHPDSKLLCTSRMLRPIHSWNPVRLGPGVLQDITRNS